MNLKTIEKRWQEKELQNLRTMEQVIKADLYKFRSNIWIHRRALRYLANVMQVGDIIKLTADGNWNRDKAGERCMIESIEEIIRRGKDEKDKIKQWQLLGKNIRFKYYALAKEAANEYRYGNNKKALVLMLLAERLGKLSDNHKRIKMQIIASQDNHIRQAMIEPLIEEHGDIKSIEIYNLLVTLAIISSKKEDIERFYMVVPKNLAQNWEYIMWFNRVPLELKVEEEFLKQIEENYNIAVEQEDHRWLYQYALAIIRHGKIVKGYSILKLVNQKHQTLRHLCEPLMRCLEEYEKDKESAKIEVTCRTQRLSIDRATHQKAICVVFSGWYSALGNIPEYIVKKKLLELGITTIIVKDGSLNWFMTKEKRIDQKLKGIINDNIQKSRSNGCKVVFIGSSITGLSALAYANECKPTAVLLYASPYREKQSIKEKENKQGKKMELRKRIVEEVFNDTKSCMEYLEDKEIEIVYEYGANNKEDTMNAVKFSRFKNCNSKSYSDVATHSISSYCTSMGYMESTLTRICRLEEWQ